MDDTVEHTIGSARGGVSLSSVRGLIQEVHPRGRLIPPRPRHGLLTNVAQFAFEGLLGCLQGCILPSFLQGLPLEGPMGPVASIYRTHADLGIVVPCLRA